jgi:hypothetical protein
MTSLKNPTRIGSDMRRKRSRRAEFTAMVIAYLAMTPGFAAAPLVNATIEPAQITVGESAQITITTLGNGMEPLTLPVVQGLEFRIVDRLRRNEIIHGATLATTTTVVRVTPQVAGIFTIPGITPTAQPLVLSVSPNSRIGHSARSPAGIGASARPPALTGATTANGIHLSADGSAFVRLSVPKRDVYVGESVPVTIDVGMREGFVSSVNGLPTLAGSEDFTLNNLSRQPERNEQSIDGNRFTLLTWHSVLAAVKPGTFSLTVESPLTVRIRTGSRQEAMLEDQLGDPFMQHFFGATVQKDIKVASPPVELTVSTLPTEGRPADFSGAVGTFKIASELSSTTAAAGDPLTLRLHVSGTGNFDRVDSSMLEHIERWKTYPPKSTFKAADALGYKGEKTFEQPLIASKPGAQTLPGLTFSYFDPTTRRYETARSAPLSVTISPAPSDSTLSAAQIAAGTAGAPANQPPSALRPDHLATDPLANSLANSFVNSLANSLANSPANSLVPLYLQTRYLGLASLLTLAFAGGWLRLRRRAAGASGRDRLSAANRVLVQLDQAARSGDTAKFVNSARSALQMAARWQGTAGQIILTEEALLGSESEDIRQLFALADEANYSGHEPTTIDFAHWTQVVRRRMLGEHA